MKPKYLLSFRITSLSLSLARFHFFLVLETLQRCNYFPLDCKWSHWSALCGVSSPELHPANTNVKLLTDSRAVLLPFNNVQNIKHTQINTSGLHKKCFLYRQRPLTTSAQKICKLLQWKWWRTFLSSSLSLFLRFYIHKIIIRRHHNSEPDKLLKISETLKTHMKLPKMSHVWQIFFLLSLARAAFAFFFSKFIFYSPVSQEQKQIDSFQQPLAIF